MKRFFLLPLILTFAAQSFAQDAVYYYGSDFGILPDSANSRYMREISLQRGGAKASIKTYSWSNESWQLLKRQVIRETGTNTQLIRTREGKVFSEKYFRTYQQIPGKPITFEDRMANEILRSGSATSLIPLHLTDTVRTYFKNGVIKSVGVFSENRLLSNKNWLISGEQYLEDIHTFVDNTPEHSLGPAHFRNYIIAGIKESGLDITQVSDRVVIGCVVLETGEIAGIHATAGMYKELNALLIKLILDMPGKWIPASLHGSPVRYYMEIPFNFIDRSEGFDNVELSSGILMWD